MAGIPTADKTSEFEKRIRRSLSDEIEREANIRTKENKPSFGKQTANFALTAADAASAGVARGMGALRNTLSEMGSDMLDLFSPREEENDPSLWEAAKEGWNQNADIFNESRNELGTAGEIAAEVVGSVTPFGVYGKADDLIGGLARYAPDLKNTMIKYALNTGTQYPTAAWDAYIRQDQDLDEALMTGVLDAAIGTTFQKVAGDFMVPAGKRLWNTLTGGADAYPAGSISSGGVEVGDFDTQGITLAGLHDLARRGDIPEGKNFLELEIGGETAGELSRRYYNALAKLTYGDAVGRKANTKAGRASRAMYEELEASVNDVFNRANTSYNEIIDTSLGDWQKGIDDVRERVGNAKTHGKLMEDMVATRPNADGTTPIGAIPFDADQFTDEVYDKLVKDFRINDLKEGGQEVNKVWNRFKDLLRAEYMTESKSWRKHVSDGKKANQIAAEEGRVLFGELPLAQLIRARRTLASTLNPGAMIDGDSVTKLENKTTMHIMDVLDDKIDEMTSSQMGTARGAFAKSMRIEEMFELGEQFYKSRGINASDPKKFGQYYDMSLDEIKASMGKDKDAWEAFQSGYKKGMHQYIGKRSPAEEMTLYLGKPTNKASDIRRTGSEDLELILGKAEADKIKKLHTEGKKELDVKDELVQLLKDKKQNPKYQADFIGIATEWAKRGGPSSVSEQQTNLMKAITLLGNNVQKPSDRKKLAKMAKILTLEGDDLRKFIAQSVDAADPGPVQIGNRASGVSSAVTDGIGLDQSILDYLQSVEDEDKTE